MSIRTNGVKMSYQDGWQSLKKYQCLLKKVHGFDFHSLAAAVGMSVVAAGCATASKIAHQPSLQMSIDRDVSVADLAVQKPQNTALLMSKKTVSENAYHNHDHQVATWSNADLDRYFQSWIGIKDNYEKVVQYRTYLQNALGDEAYIAPMNQLLKTARSWQECEEQPYQVPPQHLWHKILPTLRLYQDLMQKGVLPINTQIRSVYRNSNLNQCAGGAAASKHLVNSAIDIWVPDLLVGSWQLDQLQSRLCEYWLNEGEHHQFGLGLYATGAIHLDTQGYRKWGMQFTPAHSVCRQIRP